MTLIANPRMDNGEMTSPSGRIVVPQVYDQSASVDAATPLGWRFSNYSVQTGEEFSMDFLQERAPPRGTPSRPGMDYDHHANRVELDNYHHTGYEDAMGCRITDVRRLDLSDQSSGSKDPSSFTGGGNRADSKTTGTATATATATAGYYDQAGGGGGGGGGGGVPHDDGLRVFDNYTDGYFDSSAYSKPIQGYHHHHHRRQGSDVAESPRSNKVKFVCSFGGTILPRPGDGKLRYVGGETRIINFMNNNLSWKELMHRTFSLCNQPHIIKYQLPGEDLDALISVASDEDLENMLEEYHGLEKADGSQRRIRIFLISLSESDNSPLDSRSLHNNSEYHYVVALNNMIEPSLPRNGSGSGSGGGGGVNNNNNNNNNNNININISGTNPMGYAGDTCPNFQTDSPFLQSDFVDKIKAPARVGLFIPRPSHHLFCNNQSGLNTPIHSPPFSPKPIQKSDSRHCRKQSVEDQLAYEDHHSDKHYDLGVGYYSPSATTPNLHINNLNHDLEQPSLYVGALTYQSHMQIGATLAEQRVVPNNNNNNNNNNRNDLIPPVGCYFETSSTMQRAFHSETCPRQPEDPFSQMTNCSDSFAEAPIISHAYSDSMLQHQFERNAADMIRASYFEFAQQPYSEQQQFKRIMQGVDSDHSNLPFRSQWVTPGSSQVESLSLSNEQNHFGEYGYEISKCVNNDKQSKGQVATNSGSWNSNLQQSNPPDLTTQGHEDSNDLPNVPCQSLRYDVALEYYGNMPPSSSSPITWPMISSELPNTTMKHPQYTENQSHAEGNSNGSVGIISSPKPGYYDPSGIMSQDDIRNIRDCGAASSVTTSKPLVNSDETDTNRDLLSYESPMWALFRNVGTEETLMKDIGFHTGAPWNGQSKPKKSQAALDTILSQSQLVIVEDVTDCVPSDIPASVEIIPHVLHEDMERTQSPKPGDTDFAAASECEDSKFDGEVKDESISDAAIAEMEAGIYGLQIIKNADLEELRELGSGTFGTVYHGKWRGTDVAIKRIKKSCFAGRSSEQERLTKDFWREAQILSKLHHPNVVAFYGVVPDGCEGTLATVTEFMVNGSLRHVLQRQDRALDRRKRLIIAMDAAFGMEYLHSKRIVHFDLKCDNLLVNLRDSQRPICKVGDFGLSRIKHNTLVSGGVRGTLPWMAPELLNGRSNGVSEKVDVFSFGIVMWEILTGEEPYANMHCGQIIGGIVSNTLRPSIPDQCDVEWRKLMEECWSPDPSERPSFTEITDRLRAMSIALQSNKQR